MKQTSNQMNLPCRIVEACGTSVLIGNTQNEEKYYQKEKTHVNHDHGSLTR